MKKLTLIFSLVGLFLVKSQAFAQAISWLSQPQHEMGLVANAEIQDQKLSANGRYLTFISEAGNLVAGDDNRGDDLFLKDLVTGDVKIVTQLSNGQIIETTNLFDYSRASDDGRYVSFVSNASNLPMANGGLIVYVKDLQMGTLTADSVSTNGQLVYNAANSFSGMLEQSSDGRYLAFISYDDVVNNAGLTKNVFRKDRQNNTYQLVSVSHTGAAAGGASLEAMSPNGRHITFQSDGAVLPSSPNPGFQTNYLRDMDFGNTVLYHRDINQLPVSGSYITSAVSNQGAVAFCSFSDNLINGDTNGLSDVFVYDSGVISRVSLSSSQNEISDQGCDIYYIRRNTEISEDGQYVAFLHASNELTVENNLGLFQAYQINRNQNQAVMMSKNNTNEAAEQDVTLISMSADGQRVSLLSKANNLQHSNPTYIHNNIYMYNHNNGNTTGVALAEVEVRHWLADAHAPVMPIDMDEVIYTTQAPNAAGATEVNNSEDLYVYDRATKVHARLANHVSAGSHDVSDNGRYITFVSNRFQPVSTIELGEDHVFLYDRQIDQFSQLAVGHSPKVNDEGWVVFVSGDDSLSPIDNNGYDDIYLYQSGSQNMSLVTVAHDGGAASSFSNQPDIAGVGTATWVVFLSYADNLIAGDSEGQTDVFMQNWGQGPIQRVSENALGEGQNGFGSRVAVSANTQTIVFDSNAQNLTADVHPYYSSQYYVFDRINNQLSLITLDESGDPHDGNSFAFSLSVSSTGRYVAFYTNGYFGNDDEENSQGAIYLYDQHTQTQQRISQTLGGGTLEGGSSYGFVQADESHNPPLVSVLFTNPGDLLEPHPSSDYDQIMLYQQGGPGVDLTMQVSGQGSVSGNLGYFCQDSCEHSYDLGTTLNLLAIADQGATFLGWSGDVCQDDNISCEVIMNENKAIQAFFSNSDVIFSNGFD